VKSRWISSEVTLGPVGRIVLTVVVLAPAIFGIFVSAVFFIFGVLWLFIVPMALRDIWRAVHIPGTGKPIDFPQDPTPPAPGESLHDRRPPQRW